MAFRTCYLTFPPPPANAWIVSLRSSSPLNDDFEGWKARICSTYMYTTVCPGSLKAATIPPPPLEMELIPVSAASIPPSFRDLTQHNHVSFSLHHWKVYK